MALIPWRPSLLSAAVGNNYANNPDDILNMKHAYARVGRYKKPVENGYIDGELASAIHGIQKDYGLKRDGVMEPGGETEATLIGEALGIEKKPDPKNNIKLAMAPAVVAVPALAQELAVLFGTTAAAAWALWQEMNNEEKGDILDKLRSKGNEASTTENPEPDKNRCTEKWKSESSEAGGVCGKVKDFRNRLGCDQSAADRLGLCNKGLSDAEIETQVKLKTQQYWKKYNNIETQVRIRGHSETMH